MANNEATGTVAKCPECGHHMRPVTLRDVHTVNGIVTYFLWECSKCNSGMVEAIK